MTILFQSSDKNPYFSTKGNGQFGTVVRTGWNPARLGESKKQIIMSALSDSNTDKVYKRGNSIYRNLLNGNEEKIA